MPAFFRKRFLNYLTFDFLFEKCLRGSLLNCFYCLILSGLGLVSFVFAFFSLQQQNDLLK